jgi:hypothetical protein
MKTYSINNRQENISSIFSAATYANKYDTSYRKETEASFMGVFLLIVPILFTIFSLIDIAKNGGADTFIKVMVIGAFVIRVASTKWVSSIAAAQNRRTAGWIALSFFLPAISLIIMGQTKKLATPVASAKKQGVEYNAKLSFMQFPSNSNGYQMAS